MRTYLRMLTYTAGLALVAGACSDLLTTGDPLTDEEAAAVSQQITSDGSQAFNDAWNQPTPAPAAAAAAEPIDFRREVTRSRECPLAGSVTVTGVASGTVDRETQSGTLNLEMTTVITNCQFAHGDVTFTVYTDPSIVRTGSFSYENGHPSREATFTIRGVIAWESSDGRSGRCEIEGSVTRSAEGVSVVRNKVCGRTVQHS